MFHIVETCNFDSDYRDEKFLSTTCADSIAQVITFIDRTKAQAVVDALNMGASNRTPRWWKVVKQGYTLQPSFSS